MEELSDKQCIPCKGGVPPLSNSEMVPLLAQLNPDWQIVDGIIYSVYGVLMILKVH